MTTTFIWTRDDDTGNETEVTIKVEFTLSAYTPARRHGPPELCYEAEGGEIEEIEFSAGDNCTPEDLEAFRRAYRSTYLSIAVREACYKAAPSDADSYEQGRAEWLSD